MDGEAKTLREEYIHYWYSKSQSYNSNNNNDNNSKRPWKKERKDVRSKTECCTDLWLTFTLWGRQNQRHSISLCHQMYLFVITPSFPSCIYSCKLINCGWKNLWQIGHPYIFVSDGEVETTHIEQDWNILRKI